MIILLTSLLLSFSSQALDTKIILDEATEDAEVQQDNPFPNKAEVDAKMDAIYKGLATGVVPQPSSSTEFYSGRCLTSYSAVAEPQEYYATVALRSNEEGLQITYTTGQGKYEAYTAADIPALEKRYTPKTKPYEIKDDGLGGQYAQFTMALASATLPDIKSALSVDPNNADKMYFVAMLMGYYCELNRVK